MPATSIRTRDDVPHRANHAVHTAAPPHGRADTAGAARAVAPDLRPRLGGSDDPFDPAFAIGACHGNRANRPAVIERIGPPAWAQATLRPMYRNLKYWAANRLWHARLRAARKLLAPGLRAREVLGRREVPGFGVEHVHDIFLPADYPAQFTCRHWSEQYLLAAWLLGGARGVRVLLPCAHLAPTGEGRRLLDAKIPPQCRDDRSVGGSSVWFETT